MRLRAALTLLMKMPLFRFIATMPPGAMIDAAAG